MRTELESLRPEWLERPPYREEVDPACDGLRGVIERETRP